MKKTLCIILKKKDLIWAKKIFDKNIKNKNFLIIAPTFEGAIAMKEEGLDYHNCQDLAWKINKLKLHEESNKLILKVFNIYQNHIEQFFLKNPKIIEYPIIKMHYLGYLYYILEMLNSNNYADNILKKFDAKKIYINNDNDIYSKEHALFSHTYYAKNSLSESFRNICKHKKIQIISFSTTHKNFTTLFYKIKNFCRFIFYTKNILINNSIYFIFNSLNYLNNKKNNFKNKKKILINTENGYYFQMIKKDIDKLSRSNLGIYVNFVTEPISISELFSLFKPNIKILYNFTPSNLFKFNIFKNDSKNLKRIYFLLANKINKDKFFNNKSFLLKKNILSILKIEFFRMSDTLALLNAYEKKYNNLSIDVAFNHFDLTPLDYSLVFPLKKKNIPSISSSHGLSKITFFREAFASDFFLTQGSKYLNLLKKTFGGKEVFLSKNNYYDSLNLNYQKNNFKRRFNLDVNKPVCIFTDESSYLNNDQYTNSQFENINRIIDIKKNFPDIQLIFRYHGGHNISSIAKYINSFGYKDVLVQQHPKPLFVEIVKAADFVICHGSSAIIESLLLGVPVIYLTATGYTDSFLTNYKHIKNVNNFYSLNNSINLMLKNKFPRKKIRNESKLFFKDFSESKNSLSSFIKKIIKKKYKKIDNPNFKDWEKRLERTLKFKYPKELL